MRAVFCCCYPEKAKASGELKVTFNPNTESQPAASRDAAAPNVTYTRTNKRKGTGHPGMKLPPPEEDEDEDESTKGDSRGAGNPGRDQAQSSTATTWKGKRGRKGTGVPPKDVMKKIEAELQAIELTDEYRSDSPVIMHQHDSHHPEHGILHDPTSPKTATAAKCHPNFEKEVQVIGSREKSPTNFVKGDVNPSDALHKAAR